MAEAKKDTEEYSVFLRRQMGDTLTSGVEEVLRIRPRDPIQYLAECLYKSKKMTPPKSAQVAHDRRTKMQSWTQGFVLPDPVIPEAEYQTNVQSSDSKPVMTNVTKTTKAKQTSRSVDDFPIQNIEDDVDYQEHEFYGPEVYVHGTFLSSFGVIGDLFDDDNPDTNETLGQCWLNV